MPYNIAMYEGYGDPQKMPSNFDAAPIQLSKTFTFQSWFDNSLLSTAVNAHPPGRLIVPDTEREEQLTGYAIGLHPCSETPVAVMVGAQTLLLMPGQIVRPFGVTQKPFTSFRWGLPFGWLGGGTVTLVVLRSPDASLVWQGKPEVIIQRQTVRVTTDPATPYPASWPLRFPSLTTKRATATVAAYGQPGQPSIAVEPTRVQLRLRPAAPLSAAASMRILVQGSSAFDLKTDGTVSTSPSYLDVVWPEDVFSTVGGAPVIEVRDGALLVGCDAAASAQVKMVAHTASVAALTGAYVDVVRYGRLG